MDNDMIDGMIVVDDPAPALVVSSQPGRPRRDAATRHGKDLSEHALFSQFDEPLSPTHY
jgi:hypothetical protein